jgi:hypothetical protein
MSEHPFIAALHAQSERAEAARHADVYKALMAAGRTALDTRQVVTASFTFLGCQVLLVPEGAAKDGTPRV